MIKSFHDEIQETIFRLFVNLSGCAYTKHVQEFGVFLVNKLKK